MNRILVASVMHTGTHFVKNILLADFVAGADYDDCHFRSKHMNRIQKLTARCNIIVVPLRHPARCLASFKSRSKPFEYFVEQWNNMLGYTSDKLVYFIHLDDPNCRDEEVDWLRTVYPIAEVDWDPSLKSGAKQGNHNLDITGEMLQEIPTRFLDFYEETK